MALVLCLGSDESLIRTRTLLLERAGHKVVSVRNVRDIEQVCRQHAFDVAVIGQGIPPPERFRIADVLRELCPDAAVLELFTISSPAVLDSATDSLEMSGAQPSELAEKVSALAATRKSSGAKKMRKAKAPKSE